MAVLSILDNQYASMVYYTDEKIIHHTFHNALDSENLRVVLNAGVDLLRERRATKWLSDNREIDPHSDEDSEWINTNWLPRAIAAGWKTWALIVPDSIKARMNMNEFVNTFHGVGIRVMVFTELDEARNWLNQA